MLRDRRLMVGAPRVSVSVHESRKKNTYLFQDTFELSEGLSSADEVKDLADRIEATMRAGEIGSVSAHAKSASEIVADGEAREEAGLLCLGTAALSGYVSADLVTYSDAWLPYDLKGRPQPEVHALNAPRLAAALRDLSEALDSETDPDDPTWFAKPNETGAENIFDDRDGTPRDVWESFEVPYRYEKFTHTPGFGRIGYRRSADGDVQCVPVRGEHGLLGHLWASDAENAASFEPLDVGDDAMYRAGPVWLERLRAAHDRGLPPSTALIELSAMPDTDGAGHVDRTAPPRTVPLRSLREAENGNSEGRGA
ncbi:hypothetical protein [Streptomyces sp. DH24]|uniref:hypothetical protein n=1 Tax=Streptomyces sp. DH24 TaxID=3040123 RepID=UPI0024428537|nr:hypothetical protein [Streptomyces sp. DH24]MDG9721110.1 hypothetical protein [Streptomyces sp. DH24]